MRAGPRTPGGDLARGDATLGHDPCGTDLIDDVSHDRDERVRYSLRDREVRVGVRAGDDGTARLDHDVHFW